MLQENGGARKGRDPATEDGARRGPYSTFWLLARQENGCMEVYTLGPGGEALPVFSFKEEAEMFLRLEALGEGWRTRKTTSGELVSMLYGLCGGVRRVALDPLPAVCGGEAMLGLVSLEREIFARTLTGRDGFSAPRRSLQADELAGFDPLGSLREREA